MVLLIIPLRFYGIFKFSVPPDIKFVPVFLRGENMHLLVDIRVVKFYDKYSAY